MFLALAYCVSNLIFYTQTEDYIFFSGIFQRITSTFYILCSLKKCKVKVTEANLEPSRTSMTEFLCENS